MSCPECEKITRDIEESGYAGDCFGVDYRCDNCKAESIPPYIGQLRTGMDDYWVEIENDQGDRAYIPASHLKKIDKPHHIWCNFLNTPQESCHMCKGLHERYPYETEEEKQGLAEKHFPNAIRRD